MRRYEDLHAYQQRGITAFYEHDGIIAVVPMGGGKTVMSMTAAWELMVDGAIRHAWVFPPKRPAQLVWPKEHLEWEHLEGVGIARLTGSPIARKQLFDFGAQHGQTPHFSIVHHDVCDHWLEMMDALPDDHPYWDLLIIDEISRFRSPKSKRAKALLKRIKRFKNIWGLTGTPRPNGYQDLFKPAQIVTKSKLWGKSYYAWEDQRFFSVDWNGYNKSIRMEWRDQTIAEFAKISFTVDPADMPELPEINEIQYYIDLPADVMREYKRMEKLLFSQFKNEKNEVTIAAANKGIATGKLAQIAQGFMYDELGAVKHLHPFKADWIVDVVDNMAGTPLLIAYEFKEDLAVLRELFGEDLPYFGDGVSEAQAARWEAQWNKRELPLLALHPASAGHGLNLQHGGCHIACYGLTWSSEFYDQMIKRIHRQGQKERCFVHLCLARGTVDEMKRDRVVGKMTAQEAFNAYLKRI